MLCSPFYGFKNNFQKQTNKGLVDVKSGGPCKNTRLKCCMKKKSCHHLISKIKYVIATIYKSLSVTETDFTYTDGTNTHLIVGMADY